MVGRRFGRLTVEQLDTFRKKTNRRYWLCRCDCGRVTSANTTDLKSGKCKSCGCLKAEWLKNHATLHGESRTKLYGVWNAMKARCYNPNAARYPRYGARGIEVCDEWRHDYYSFKDWAIANGYAEGLTIDRVDVNGNYCPDNCRWITSAEQMKNMSSNRMLTHNGETHTLSEWAKMVGITAPTLSKRLKRGWSLEQALTTVRISVK